MTLTEFLLARIAEDEKWARQRGRWRIDTTGCCVVDSEDGDTIAEMVWDNAAHIARWSPARVLAECEAKRRIVNAYLEQITPDEDGFANHREDDTFGWFDADRTYHHGTIGMEFSDGAFVALRNACRALALPYADHPDFDPAWRDTPET